MVNHAQSWKFLKETVSKITDKTLQNVMMAEFRKRAVRDWGYNPDSKYGVAKEEKVELDDWEKEFLKDIQDFQEYQIDTRVEKREKTAKEAKVRMLNFIECGRCLNDIPDDVRTDTIVKLYYDCLNEYGDLLMEEADRLIGANK